MALRNFFGNLAVAKALRTTQVNHSAAQALREMFCQLRAFHAAHNSRFLRAAVTADVHDPAVVP
eukprot:238141-Amphidinium_carterae.3